MGYFEMDCPCKGKNLDKMLQPAILTILCEGSAHGFILAEKIGDSPMFGGTMPDKTGVYRYLKKMEESQLLSSKWEMGEEKDKLCRIYEITEKGKDCLCNWSKALKEYEKSIELLIKDIDKATT